VSLSTPPRPRDAATTRQTILDAAEDHFAESGFAGARVDEIAKSAGYNKSLIFQYFTDKDGLYRAVMSRCREVNHAAFRVAIDADAILERPLTRASLRAALEASTNWVFEHFVEHPNYLRLFSWEMALGWSVFKESSEEIEPSFRFGLEMLRRAQTQGLLREGIAPETVVVNVFSLPFVTLAAVPRFQAVRDAALYPPYDTSALREQTVRFVLNAVLK
jgi:TetR/AcrR family transcriptional regulator